MFRRTVFWGALVAALLLTGPTACAGSSPQGSGKAASASVVRVPQDTDSLGGRGRSGR